MDQEQQGISIDASIPGREKNKVEHHEPPTPKCVLSVHAHPDDQEFTVSGTLAKWARAGSEIVSVIVTSGDSGSNERTDPTMTKTALSELREKEQLAACAVLGVKETVYLRQPDGMLQPTLDLRRALTRLIRKYKPDVVICGDPTRRFYGNSYMNHPDHRVVGDVTCDAVFPSAGTKFIFPELLAEGLEPHNVKKLFLHGSDTPDVYIDVTETISVKVAALREHKSQIGSDWDLDKEMREWAAEQGKAGGVPYAEAFHVMVLVDDEAKKEDEKKVEMEYAEAER